MNRESLSNFGSGIQNRLNFRSNFPVENFAVAIFGLGILVLTLGAAVTALLDVAFAWVGIPFLVFVAIGLVYFGVKDYQESGLLSPKEKFRQWKDARDLERSQALLIGNNEPLHDVVLGDRVVTVDEHNNVVGTVREHAPKGLITETPQAAVSNKE